MRKFEEMTVGEIATLNIEYTKVFQKYNIDFCCGGDILLPQAIEKAKVLFDDVLQELNTETASTLPQALNFDRWSLDLLIDYIFKFHHNYIRIEGPKISALLNKVVEVHGNEDAHLEEIQTLFTASLLDLDEHLAKEENILFPYILEIMKEGVEVSDFHCGSVENPIRVMEKEHEEEGRRFRKISELANGYTPPLHACNSYRLVLKQLKEFEENLHIHIHVENNILFTKSIKMQNGLN